MTETENKATQKDKKRIVKALFSYTPINSDELQLKINDVLEVIEETEEGWWKGVLNGNVGMFPSNFVAEHYSEASSNQTTNEMSPTKLPAKVKNVDLQDGTKHDSTHSSSSKPDNIKTIINNLNSNSDDKIDDKPKISDTLDRKGSASKKNTVDSAAPRLPPKPVREQARVIYPYTALNEDELSLKEGDIITVISKEVEDKGWWKGELNNRTGVFPDNFVQLIKVEEQKKPERPDKPSAAFTSKANLKSSDKASSSEFSPKADKRVLKVPPVKPPPPEIHKKEIDRPSPPFPSKKPQVPHPMKKPSRSSLGSKFSGFTSPALAKPLIPETTHVAAPIPLATETKPIPPGATETKPEVPKNAEKFSEKEEKSKNQDIGFEGLELSGKKLVHLTANRVKAPNRRPPSHVFLRESEKENGFSPDSRRLSEPLLSEMKSMLNLVDTDFHKPNVSGSSEGKTARIPPSRPLPPSLKASKPTVQGSIVLTKTISSEECIVKAPEPIKKAILPDNSIVPVSEFLQPKKTDLAPSVNLKFLKSGDNELQELKESIKSVMCTMVSQKEFNELSKQMQMPPNKVKDLKESLEKCSIHCNELKNELESEKRLRESLEIELHQIKEHQTT